MDIGRFSFDQSQTQWVAVSVESTTDCTAHAGMLFRDANRALFILHLTGHENVRKDTPSPVAAYAIPNLDEEDQLFLSGLCDRIWKARNMQLIPYAFRSDTNISFDRATGELVMKPGTPGLDCASFVMKIFESAGHRPIDDSGWPPAGDTGRKARKKIMEWMNQSGQNAAQQAQRIAAQLNDPWIRPEDVAGACLEDAWPVNANICQANGDYVRGELDRNYAAIQAQNNPAQS